uniref:Uncharacterized protein n=1 Tax=Cucumis melo TaxID=3656 RepID=A0A9I9CZ33_CUCME
MGLYWPKIGLEQAQTNSNNHQSLVGSRRRVGCTSADAWHVPRSLDEASWTPVGWSGRECTKHSLVPFDGNTNITVKEN